MKKILSIAMLIVALVTANTKTMMHIYRWPLPDKMPIAVFPNFTVVKDMERIAAFTIYKREAYRLIGRSGGLSSWAKYKLPKKKRLYATSDLKTKNRIGGLYRELDTLDPKIKKELLGNKVFLSELEGTKGVGGLDLRLKKTQTEPPKATGEEIIPYSPKLIILKHGTSVVAFTAKAIKKGAATMLYVVDRKPSGNLVYSKFGPYLHTPGMKTKKLQVKDTSGKLIGKETKNPKEINFPEDIMKKAKTKLGKN